MFVLYIIHEIFHLKYSCNVPTFEPDLIFVALSSDLNLKHVSFIINKFVVFGQFKERRCYTWRISSRKIRRSTRDSTFERLYVSVLFI